MSVCDGASPLLEMQINLFKCTRTFSLKALGFNAHIYVGLALQVSWTS